jgi:predicted nicotinamide N-methyase
VEPESKTRRIELPGGRALTLRGPAAPEKLLDAIDAATFRIDERMPYWAEAWPAGIALAGQVLEGRPPLAGKRVLELGSGLGLVGIAAALAGAREVVLSDWFPESLEAALENARLNGVPDGCVRALHLDWRAPPEGLAFEAIVGADLLYERHNLAFVCSACAALLAPGGRAWIADPDRITAEGLIDRAEEAGLKASRSPLTLPGARRGWLYELRARETPPAAPPLTG